MARRVVALTLDTLDDLPRDCRQCVFWELDPVAGPRAVQHGDPAFEKESWVSATLLEWGSCGRIVSVDGAPAGFALYAPPGFVPRSLAFPTSPVGADAVVLATVQIRPQFAGQGLGRMLVQAAAKDLLRRGIRAVEAFGSTAQRPLTGAGPGRGGPAARSGQPDDLSADVSCVLPVDFLLSVGFRTVRQHPRWPRLRLDLQSTVSLRDEVEVALERILGTMAPEPAFRPV